MTNSEHALNLETHGPLAFALPKSYRGLSSSRRWLLACVIVTLAVLLVTTLWYINALRENPAASWGKIFVGVAFEWYPWALFAPLISLLVARYPLERSQWLRNMLIHLFMSVAVALIQNGSATLGALVRRPDTITSTAFANHFIPYLLWMAPWSIAIYFGIAAILTASDFRTRLVQREWLASKLESELTRAQLTTLYSQLQPHFLFNTLNSISVLMNTSRIDDAQKVLRELSELLRYVLARGETQLVTVADEVAFVERYLSIEKTRYAERLEFKMEVDPSILSAQSPTFLLQTLVENAVRHGVSPKLAGGSVVIRVSRQEDSLHLQVTDSGVGLSKSSQSEGSGVGLRNTKARLEHLYGDHYRFDLVNGPSGGTIATVVIPLSGISENK
jgi:signal transduction histidine kinase